MFKSILRYLLAPFQSNKGFDIPLLAVFLVVHALLLVNVILHDPSIGYDGADHLKNIQIYSQLRFPHLDESREFFSPPLAYLPPALLIWLGVSDVWVAAKFAQLINVFLSMGVFFYVLKICELIASDNRTLKLSSLTLLSILPVYYRTFAFVRGEPMVVFFSVLSVYLTLLIFYRRNEKPIQVIALGLGLGLGILSRQWSFFPYAAILLFVALLAFKYHTYWKAYLSKVIIVLAVSFITGSWFYIHLFATYGTITAFNYEGAASFSFSNQPKSFYFGLGSGELFSIPLRPHFTNQLLPTLYADTWGDYWLHFIVYGKDTRDGRWVVGQNLELISAKKIWLETNYHLIKAYQGRVNLFSLFPTALFLSGLFLGIGYSLKFFFSQRYLETTIPFFLFTLIILVSFVGYIWFLIQYPTIGRGDTIKATYLIYIFPFFSLLTAQFLEAIDKKSRPAYYVILGLMALLFIHNLPVMVTRYIPNWISIVLSPKYMLGIFSTLGLILGLLLSRWIHSYSQLNIRVSSDGGASSSISTRIFVIVPARNEARNIRRCVEALLAQNYPNFELIVVDDRSSDATPQILADIAARDNRLLIVPGSDLPKGWAGKPHAVYQGVQAITGKPASGDDWLCFVDADTFARPTLLASTLATAQSHEADLFTLLTDQELGSFWEKVVMPLVFTALSFGFSATRVNDPGKPDAIANGQFILVRRSVYDAVGGHQAIQDSIVEDKALAELVKGHGYRLIIADGRDVAHTRMYTSLSEIWEGWTKNIYLGLQDRLWLLLFGAFMGLIGAFVLPLWLSAGLFWFAATGRLLAAVVSLEAVILWAYLLWLRFRATQAYQISPFYALTLPLGAFIFTAMMCASAFRVLSRKGVVWKGRVYDK